MSRAYKLFRNDGGVSVIVIIGDGTVEQELAKWDPSAAAGIVSWEELPSATDAFNEMVPPPGYVPPTVLKEAIRSFLHWVNGRPEGALLPADVKKWITENPL